MELKDEAGNLNDMLSILAEGEININYIYSFVIRQGRAPVLVFNTDDHEKAAGVLKSADVKIMAEPEL